MVQETSSVIKKRTNALKNLQLKMSDIESKLADEVHKLECKYAKLFEPIYEQREKIVNGEYEPTETETTWEYQDDLSDEEQEPNGSVNKKQKTEGSSSGSSSSAHNDVKGLPEFWLTAFQGNGLINGLISEKDQQVLKHLRDVRVKLSESNRGYTIEFHFNENEFFSNRVLTKAFVMNTEKNKVNPLSSHLPALLKCTGTKIDWKAGKDVTVRVEKTKSKKNEDEDDDEETSSFFHIFDTHTADGVNPIFKEDSNSMNQEQMAEICQSFEIDYEIGQALKELIVPKAVLYYTGDLDDEDEAFDEFGEDENDDDVDDDDDDDDDDEDDESEEEQPKKKKNAK